MTRTDFYATTALGLCLAVAPLTASAQSAAPGLDGAQLFAPRVQACIALPSSAECQEILAMVSACNETLGYAQCELLFNDPDSLFNNPVQLEQARVLLAQTTDAMTQAEAAGAETSEPADTAIIAQTDAATDEAARDLEEERRLREALQAAQDAADAEAGMETQTETEGSVAVEADVQTETEAQADSDALAEQRIREALEAQQRQADVTNETRPEAPAGDLLATESPSQALDQANAEADREEERVRLRAEAAAIAEDEPELIVEEAPAEEYVAPADEQRTLDVAQQGELDRLLDEPEVAAAVTVLSGVAEESVAAATPDQPNPMSTSALRALQRDQRGGGSDPTVTEPEAVIEDQISATEIRSSRDDFESRFALDFDAGQARRDDRRDLERAGLVALGALAVGMIINQNRVVARSDERVVVLRDNGEYAVWRDDDVILRQEGSQRRIERYADGSTLTRWDRTDGSQIVTIRDATGRLLWRERILADGTSIELVNDMREVQPINVSALPPPRRRELLITQRTDPERALVLLREAEADARGLDRFFTLRQIREVREVRELVPILSPEPITFATNRANVGAAEAPKLAQVGRLMERLIADNPRELFLVEGYTDATGPAAYNLALSDRRAESVALALTEFFNIPSENLIIQGYGERHLRIPTAAAEELNRRVAIRRISPLLGL